MNSTVNLENELVSMKKPELITPAELLVIQQDDMLTKENAVDTLSRVGIGQDNTKMATDSRNKLGRIKAIYDTFNKDRVFHISQIKKTCVRYHLRFLSSSLYEGHVDPDLAAKIVTFETAHELKCTSANSFIMAPASAFKLEKKPTDPLFFVSLGDDYYYLIHKWGNDLSVYRRTFRFLSNPWLSWLTVIIGSGLIITSIWPGNDGIVCWSILSFVFSFLNVMLSNNEDQLRFVKRNVWNSTYE